MFPSSFEYFTPSSLDEAHALLKQYGIDAKIVAGGQSLIPMMKLRLAQPKYVLDLSHVPGLNVIERQPDFLSIGSMATYYEIMTSPLVRKDFPIMEEALKQVADIQVRNRGTLGGSIAHADPAADMPAVLLALEGTIVVQGPSGEKLVPANEFFLDAFYTAMDEDDIVTRILLPNPPDNTGTSYMKFANKASHFAIVGVAVSATIISGKCTRIRIGITGAGPRATRAWKTEAFLEGKEIISDVISNASMLAGDGIDFLGDIHASEEYREHLTNIFVRRTIEEAMSRSSSVS